jgi:succinate-semialdehyde dehydrogenase/glutarate-semialdehyde dehydrogenase
MRYQVVNPATGQLEREFPTATGAEISEVLTRAEQGYLSWRQTSKAERADILRRVAQLYRDRSSDLGAIITREMGKTTAEAKGELKFTAAIYRYYAEQGPELLKDEPLPSRTPGAAWVRKSPIGPLLGIMPWNYPYYQVARFAGPNLVIGNTILLKHAPQCPESALAMDLIFHEAGVPQDAYINIFATNDQIEWVIADPRVRGVSLTGSERAGAAVAEIAGRNLKKVVLELGGSDPFIVLDTADMDSTVEQAVGARLENSGQACNAAKRFIVVDQLYDEFTEKFSAALLAVKPSDPTKEGVQVGPLSSSIATERLADQVKRAVDQGATLVAGGTHDGNFFETTILTDIQPDNDAYAEEFFGPVASIYRVTGEDEAIKLANDTPFGLGSYVITSDPEQAMRVADQIDAGMVFVNAAGLEGAELPFGGVKRSGFGRELGRFGADEFVNKKLIRIAG